VLTSWPFPPPARQQVVQLLSLPKPYRTTGFVLAIVGLLLSAFCLGFSFLYQNHTILKLASVRINNIIIFG
jgi:hypothetical protein